MVVEEGGEERGRRDRGMDGGGGWVEERVEGWGRMTLLQFTFGGLRIRQ